jgi:SSS family solute:Na+ symporter
MGWPAFWWLGAGVLGFVMLGAFWVGPMRHRPRYRTLPQWAGAAYGLPARMLAAGLIAIMWMAVTAAQWAAAGTVLHELCGWSMETGVLVTAIVTAAYTARGGQHSVLRTDVVQVVVILLAMVVLAWICLNADVPTDVIWPSAADLWDTEKLPVHHWLALMLVVGGMFVVGPDICSRVLAARDVKSARIGAWIAALVLIPCAWVLTASGVVAASLDTAPGDPQQALPFLISNTGAVHPTLATGVNLGLLAALLSSADTCLMTAASVLELDLVGRNLSHDSNRARTRLFIFGLAAFSAILALVSPRVIPNLLLAYSFYCGGLLVPLLLLCFPRARRFVPRPWVCIAMSAGGLTPVVFIVARPATDRALVGALGCLVCSAVLAAGFLSRRLRGKPRHAT